MSIIRGVLVRIAGLFAGRRADAELREELETHLEMETAEHMRRGMTRDAARRQALLTFGGLTQGEESVRRQRGLPWVEHIAADIRYALRALRRTPTFTAVVVLTLALGIGANTAIFSVVRGVLLKPLPHRDGDRLLYLRHSIDGPGGENLAFSVPEVEDLRAGVRSFGDIAEFSTWSLTLRQEGDGPVRIPVGLVTGNYFEVLGLSPVLGRLTNASDDGAGAAPVMVLTHDFWMKRFAGDPAVIGTQVTLLDGQSATVIGVVQPAPFFPDRADALFNMAISEHHTSAFMVQGRTHRMTEVIARLAPGATLEQAMVEVDVVRTRLQREYPDAYDAGSNHRMAVIPFQDVLGERARLTLRLLMGAAAFVLIISAANVANLTLMRGVRREHELVVRASLGAGVSRLRRLLLAENLALTCAGATLGVLLAIGGVGLLTSFAARYSPRADEIRLDLAVLGFTLALAVTLALLLSFVASLPREGTFAAWIAAGGRRMSGGLRKQRLQRALVVAQVAVSLMLLAGAGLLTRTMVQLSNVHTGLETEEVLTMGVALLTPTQLLAGGGGEARERYEHMVRELRAMPGVIEVGLGSVGPLQRSSLQFEVKTEGRPLAVGEAVPRAELRTANPEYFRAVGIPVRSGRAFASTDQPGAGRVAIINQTMADRYFPGEDPIGRRIAWTGDVLRFTPFSDEWRTVVGVVGDTQDGGLDVAPRPVVFLPFAQELPIAGALSIRVEHHAARFIPEATRIVRRIAPSALIEDLMTVAQIKDRSVAPRRLNAALISAFSLLAVTIAAVGIAGVLAFSVSARTTEIGIRMSLGADGARVQRMILEEGAILLGLGLALGVAGTLGAARVIRGLLFGVEPYDPVTLTGVVLLMAAIGLIACWLPARRAARIDPAIAMRAS